MRSYRPGGLVWVNDGYRVVEHDTFTCRHCQHVTVVPHRGRPEDVGGLCYVCMGLICPSCVGKGCAPIERRLEAEEARGRMLRDMGFIE